MAYFVEFTSGDYSESIAELQDKSDAIAVGAEKQKEYEAAGKHGIITAYEMSTVCGIPIGKCTGF